MDQHMTVLQFPGQGSQRVGMGKDLCARSPAAAAVFARADELLGFPLSHLCFEGPAETLLDTRNTQPAVLTTSVAALRALEERVGRPAFVAGHSVGEFSALVAAGALDFEEALLLVRQRGELMHEAGARNPGGMAAVLGLDAPQVEDVCSRVRENGGGYVGVACDNAPGQVVISGEERALQIGMEAASAAGARRVIRLAVSIAGHSPLMAGAAAAFRHILQQVPICAPSVPVVANTTACPLVTPDQIREALIHQLCRPIRWASSIRWMICQGVTHFVEAGPGDVLTGLLRRIDRAVERLTTTDALS